MRKHKASSARKAGRLRLPGRLGAKVYHKISIKIMESCAEISVYNIPAERYENMKNVKNITYREIIL
jgi:hypothetical protein